jgi:hypothetical protein
LDHSGLHDGRDAATVGERQFCAVSFGADTGTMTFLYEY